MEKVIKWVQGGCLMWRGGAGCGRAAAHDIIDISSTHYTVHYTLCRDGRWGLLGEQETFLGTNISDNNGPILKHNTDTSDLGGGIMSTLTPWSPLDSSADCVRDCDLLSAGTVTPLRSGSSGLKAWNIGTMMSGLFKLWENGCMQFEYLIRGTLNPNL